ncbi:MarR family winged helix-turn-helix transcriptional regulator [Devosia sp. XK-2]|uniref:MarR family winged helix-turn-helix transcriptional regulator n=1 Tax=Devosia sp. XK-2 TaxID=3126689 RepID=UPI0030CE7D7C
MAYVTRAERAARQWGLERPDLKSEGMKLVGQIAEAALLIGTHHAPPRLAALGIKTGEFDVLATLRRAGAPFALTPTDLYGATMLSSGGMTARIDSLARQGLVERRAHPTDRRGTLVALTQKGLALIDDLMPAHADNKNRTVSALAPEEREALSRLLAKLIASVDPDSPHYIGGPERLSETGEEDKNA